MEFPEDFNQLELFDTHGDLIPRGARSSWTASKDDEAEVDDGERTEEWYQKKEDLLKDKPKELILWAAENNRVSAQIVLSSGSFIKQEVLIITILEFLEFLALLSTYQL